MLKALKSASKRTRTRLLAAALALLAVLATAVSIYAATDGGSSRPSKHAALVQGGAALAKGGVKGLHEGRAPVQKPGPTGQESSGATEAGTTLAATRTTGNPLPTGTGGSGGSSGFHRSHGGPGGPGSGPGGPGSGPGGPGSGPGGPGSGPGGPGSGPGGPGSGPGGPGSGPGGPGSGPGGPGSGPGGPGSGPGGPGGGPGGRSSPKGTKTAPGGAGKAGQQGGASFSISGSPDGPLSPGGAPSAIPLTLANPNDVTIHVTSLQTAASGGAPGCEATTNLLVTQAEVTSAHAIAIPAHASVTLPAQGISAPTIQMLDLEADQDACAGAQFTLQYSGKAES